MNNKVVAIIPVLNPQKIILNIVDNLVKYGFKQIIVVDDGSTENVEIFSILSELNEVIVLKHPVNLGKGRALKTAFIYTLNYYSEHQGVVTIDADGQHKCLDIQKCTENLKANCLDNMIVLGCRQFNDIKKIPLRSRFGNSCTKYVLRYLCNIKVSDSQTGLRAIPMHMLSKLLKVTGEGYEYETNMLLEVINKGGGILEVPIETVYEDNNSTSHFNPIKDSIKIYTVIIKYSLSSLLSAVIDNLVFMLLSFQFSDIYMMTFISRAITAMFNFVINKKIVFKKEGDILSQSIKYVCLLMISGGISAFCVSVLYKILHINILVLKLMIELILYFFNFYVQKNFVFIRRKRENAD